MFREAYLPEHRVPPPACPKDRYRSAQREGGETVQMDGGSWAALWTAFIPVACPPELIRSPQTGEFYFGIDRRKTRGSSIPHLGKATQF